MLLRGGEYIFRFDGSAWVMQSHISLIGGVGGGKTYVSDTMPENLSPGDGWVDTSVELETPVTQGQMATYVDTAIQTALGSIELAEEGAY